MKKTILLATVWSVASAYAVQAQDAGFTYEGEVEIGVDSTISADDPAAEITDGFVSAELSFEATITQNLTFFGGLVLESVLDAEDDRAFDDLGLYFSELGLRYSLGKTAVSFGKISPVFAKAWDEAPGFYGSALAEDYELSEMIGASVETPVGPGTLSIAAFYVDDTALSDSIGTKRGRVSVAGGGAGNTGKLNNVALQYDQAFGDTTAWVGARFLSAGQGDPSDETGIVLGAAHDFGGGMAMIGEVAHFDGAGGTDEDATYLTLGGSYVIDAWTFSATGTVIDNDAAATDSLVSLGIDRNISENLDMSFGVARFDVGGEKSTAVGLSGIYAF
ncbi:hypothetical protein Z945_2217 [Sulfitobacter noctilucae]|uniref:porin n=1 Tax=Sulfitobacter noctilucae TaxID=1342302 RepID=UPI00046A0C21|nr:porin [Sulfitobacter noctilucae]KIN61227.1 hypothetical protein Z945_2217 [Sulfitobacter noctilucae]